MEWLKIVLLPFWAMALAEGVGIPLAWLRLRGTEAWRERPRGVRRIDLLASFIAPVTVGAAVAAVVLAICLLPLAAIEVLSGWLAIALIYASPLVLVPWAVAGIDCRRLAQLDLYVDAER
jgi:hypothetical protein